MSKAAIVYWSATGNTEAMAEAVLEGARTAGVDAALITAGDFDATQMDDYDAVAFGCPAMGAEVLEEDEFEPMFTGCEGKLAGKHIGLFGSYGWGDGQWMRDWQQRCGWRCCCTPISAPTSMAAPWRIGFGSFMRPWRQ